MTSRKWTTQDIDYIKLNYSDTSNKELHQRLGRSIKAIYNQAHLLGLYKSKEFKSKTVSEYNKAHPNKGAFRKGNISFNKGKKQTDYMSKGAIEKTKQTRFKKGHIPATAKYDGALSIRKDSKTKIPYCYIRISKANWQLYNRYLYEKYYNIKLKTGDNIIFLNGDRTNFSKGNLKKVSNAELMEINALRNKTEDERLVHSTLIKLRNLVNKRNEELNENK